MKIWDEKNQVLTMDMVGPEREATVGPSFQNLFSDLAPIYALYREFKNSNSAYYRLICLFKIMEGIFCVLRGKAYEEAKTLGIKLLLPKERVPNHSDIPEFLRGLIDKPIKDFYDNVLERGYRDVASHFLIKESNQILHVSSAEERLRFSAVAFISDLCVQILIKNHEDVLRQLSEARGTRGL